MKTDVDERTKCLTFSLKAIAHSITQFRLFRWFCRYNAFLRNSKLIFSVTFINDDCPKFNKFGERGKRGGREEEERRRDSMQMIER